MLGKHLSESRQNNLAYRNQDAFDYIIVVIFSRGPVFFLVQGLHWPWQHLLVMVPGFGAGTMLWGSPVSTLAPQWRILEWEDSMVLSPHCSSGWWFTLQLCTTHQNKLRVKLFPNSGYIWRPVCWRSLCQWKVLFHSRVWNHNNLHNWSYLSKF